MNADVCRLHDAERAAVSQTPDWLTELIDHPTWRSLVYKLAEDYPDCLMLTFTIKVRPEWVLDE